MKTEALKLLLLPFARFCVRRSIKLQELNRILKEVLLQAATEELEKKGEALSASRLSVMTGVHRKDVKVFNESNEVSTKPESIATKIIGHWRHSKKFTTKAKTPKILSFEGPDSEFASLVKSVSQDLNPYTVLFELERMQIVSKTKRGLKLDVHFYLPEEDINAGLSLLGADVDDLICGVEENLYSPIDTNHLHLKTEYDKIPAEDLPKIKKWLIDEGSTFHKKLRNYLSKFDRDLSGKEKSKKGDSRVAVGLFSFSKEVDEDN